MKYFLLYFRKAKEPLAWSVPVLADYDNLKKQFEWLGNGSIEHLIKKSLVKEVRVLEQFLLGLRDKGLREIINLGKKECMRYWSDSGDTYHWVAVFQAAEAYWGIIAKRAEDDGRDENDSDTEEEEKVPSCLFRMYEDNRKTEDDTSPYICVKLRDR